MMRVLHLCSSDIGGGAARAAYRLHCGLRLSGTDSGVLAMKRMSNDPDVRKFEPPRTLRKRLLRRTRRMLNGPRTSYRPLGARSVEVFSTDRSEHGGDVAFQVGTVDVINLHWVAEMFDWGAFFQQLPANLPLVWTLHDMNPLTGGCHFDGQCGRAAGACGKCPQLDSNQENDLSHAVWKRKKEAIGRIPQDRLTMVGPSRWLTDQARQSSLFGQFRAECIPYGLDTDTFKPRDRAAIRDVLGIPQNARVVLFVASSIANRRKGFDLLRQALGMVRRDCPVWLLSIGGKNEVEGGIGEDATTIPHTTNDRYLSFIYSAADLFVIPSREDNLPNTAMESLACGTPLAGFAVGGIPDMIRPGVTGMLAAPENVQELALAIRLILTSDEMRRQMSVRCREIAVAEYSLTVQAKRYQQLYARFNVLQAK